MIEAGVDMDNPIAARAVHDQAFFKPAFEAYRDNFKKLYDTGVTVLAGSDMVLYKAPPLPIHQELGYMVDYGITPMEAMCPTSDVPTIASGTEACTLLMVWCPTR